MAKKNKLLVRFRKFHKDLLDFLSFCASVFVFFWQSIKTFFYETTLPLTQKYLSRPPRPPVLNLKDVRCKRIRLGIEPQLSSPFNVEKYETEYSEFVSEAHEPKWIYVGQNELLHRTVARLKPGQQYIFRVKTHNNKGTSGWSNTIVATTKLEPVDGGGTAANYTWTQSFTEVGLTFKVLVEGTLSKRVKNFNNGSYWELVRDNGQLVLIITFEKEARSMSPKFDFWRSVFVGEPEIDTHHIVYDQEQAPNIIQPGTMDPAQLSALGYKS